MKTSNSQKISYGTAQNSPKEAGSQAKIWYTRPAASRYLGMNVKTLQTKMDKGLIDFQRDQQGGWARFHINWLETYIERNRHQATAY